MKVKLKKFDEEYCIPNQTKIRVFCTHGYWDGIYDGCRTDHTRNQPNQATTMVLVKATAHTSPTAQHPKQCRIIDCPTIDERLREAPLVLGSFRQIVSGNTCDGVTIEGAVLSLNGINVATCDRMVVSQKYLNEALGDT